MFFQNGNNPKKLGKNRDAVMKLTEGKTGRKIVEIILYKLNSLYGNDRIIASFLTFVRKHRNEVFPYLDGNLEEKTSNKAESHFSISHGC